MNNNRLIKIVSCFVFLFFSTNMSYAKPQGCKKFYEYNIKYYDHIKTKFDIINLDTVDPTLINYKKDLIRLIEKRLLALKALLDHSLVKYNSNKPKYLLSKCKKEPKAFEYQYNIIKGKLEELKKLKSKLQRVLSPKELKIKKEFEAGGSILPPYQALPVAP